MKKQIPLLITLLIGLLMIAEEFVPHPPFDLFRDYFSTLFNILAAFAFVLGGANLLKINLNKVSKRGAGWGYALVTAFGFVVMLVVGLFKVAHPEGWKGALDNPQSAFGMIYESVQSPLQSTMFSLLAFYVASASFRAFRAKNREATILLIAAFIILMGRTLVGAAITLYAPGFLELSFGLLMGYLAFQSFQRKAFVSMGALALISATLLGRLAYGYAALGWAPGAMSEGVLSIPRLVNWMMVNPALAGQRAIMIGISLGVVSMSLRVILGIERSHLGGDE